jgi:hypothetical protein
MADGCRAVPWARHRQAAADELVGGERHHLLPVGAGATIVFVTEGDAGRVEAEQATVRDGDPMSVARQIGEHGLWPREGWLARRIGRDSKSPRA